MSRPVARFKTEEELRIWRADLLAKTGMPEDLLFERGAAFELYPEHRDIYETVRSIDYLLGSTESETPQP